jgi:hypothetical protein
MQKKPDLYCYKNILYSWAFMRDYCSGPNGDGMEESCRDCFCSCKDIQEVQTKIGEYVVDKVIGWKMQ